MYRSLLFALGVLLIHSTVIGQSPNFRHYTVEENLPSSECYQVLQDKKGFMWVATDKGVGKFDGYRFKNFNRENGLPENCIVRMYEDSKGRIWCAGLSGKLAYYENNTFTSLSINDELSKNLGGGVISSMAFQDDTLWVAMYNNSVLFNIYFKNKVPQLKVISEKKKFGAYLKEFKNGDVIQGHISTMNSQSEEIDHLYLYKNGHQKALHKIFDPSATHQSNVRSIVFNKNECLFSNAAQILHLKNQKIIQSYSFNSHVLFMHLDSNKGLWIGTMKGLLYYPNGKIDSYCITFLKENVVSCITEDKEGGIWITTLENGLYYLIEPAISNITEFSNPYITCILAQGKNIYAGLPNSHVAVIKDHQTTEISIVLDPLFTNFVRLITPVNSHKILVGGSKGLVELNQKNTAQRWLVDQKTTNYYACIPNKKRPGHFWGTGYKTIYDLNILTNKVQFISNPKLLSFLTMAEDSQNRLWLGGISGLYLFDGKNFIFKGGGSSLLSSRINDLGIVNNTIWMATKENGICIKRGNKIYQVDKEKGIPSNICQNLFLESERVGWISTNRGACKITVVSWNPFKISIKTYSTKNGLLSNEINDIYKTENMVYIASSKGISWFDERAVQPNKIAPPVYVTHVQINKKYVTNKKKYELKYDQNNLDINYVGLAYKNAGNIEYSYRMLGLDSNWIPTKYSKVTFTTLPFGKYTFEVKAKNNDGYWTKKPSKISFEISPPFWHTWFFRISAGLLFVSSIYWFVNSRVKIVQIRANETAKLYQQTVEMEMKFLSSQMNPHFTFNAMNSIQYYLLENEPETAQRYLAKYSKLIRKVLENNMKTYVKLEEEIEMLGLYMDIESLRFEIQFDYEINRSEDVNNENFSIPPMIIQPYIENAIWHGLSNKKNGTGKIILTFEYIDKHLKCTIEDNGVGRKKAAEMKSSKEQKQSLGMLITQKRLRQLHSDSEMEIKPIVTDLFNQNNEPSGTRIELWLPFLQEKVNE